MQHCGVGGQRSQSPSPIKSRITGAVTSEEVAVNVNRRLHEGST